MEIKSLPGVTISNPKIDTSDYITITHFNGALPMISTTAITMRTKAEANHGDI